MTHEIEYEVLTYAGSGWRTGRMGPVAAELFPALTRLGEMGWEVVSAFSRDGSIYRKSDGWRYILLRRRVPAQEKAAA